MGRRLRVLSEHPQIGRPGDLLPEFDGAQAFVDAGLAEWADRAVVRSPAVETTVSGPAEVTVRRRSRPSSSNETRSQNA